MCDQVTQTVDNDIPGSASWNGYSWKCLEDKSEFFHFTERVLNIPWLHITQYFLTSRSLENSCAIMFYENFEKSTIIDTS